MTGEGDEDAAPSSPTSELAKRRAAAKSAKAEAEAETAATGEEAAESLTADQPALVALVSRVVQLLTSVVVAIVQLLRRLLTPDAVSFD